MNLYARNIHGGLRVMEIPGDIEDPSIYLKRHRTSIALESAMLECIGPVLAVVDGTGKGKPYLPTTYLKPGGSA